MNYLIYVRPKIEVLYDWMAVGLIHHRRTFINCNSAMKFVYNYYEPKYQYLWICPLCFKERHINQGTPGNGHNILAVDRAIVLWVERANTNVAAHLAGTDAVMSQYMTLIRKSTSKYLEVKIKKYLKFDKSVAIDETLIGRQNWSFKGSFP